MKLTARGKRLAFAFYSFIIVVIVYNIMTIDNGCIEEDLAKYLAHAYNHGTPEEIEHARETIYKWRGGIQLNDDGTHQITFYCVTTKAPEKY